MVWPELIRWCDILEKILDLDLIMLRPGAQGLVKVDAEIMIKGLDSFFRVSVSARGL